jgi:DUF971 family protein
MAAPILADRGGAVDGPRRYNAFMATPASAHEDRLIEMALQQPMAADEYRPADLRLDRRDGLTIQWADGRTSHYSLAYLRQRCPCATCRTKRSEGPPVQKGLSLNVLPAGIDKATLFADAKLVGHYAIQITWADGHSTGIYDFRLLRVLDSIRNEVQK